MTKRDKAGMDAASDGLFVINITNDIEADEVLALLRDIYDSYPNVASLTVGQIPVMSATDGVAEGSFLAQLSDRLQCTRPYAGPGERVIDIGPISAVAEGSTVGFLDRTRNKMFSPIISDMTDGVVDSRNAFFFKPQDNFTTTPSAVTPTETFSTTILQFQITNANLGTAKEYRNITRAAGAAPITGANLTIRRNSHTDVPVFDFIRDVAGGTGFDLAGGAGVTETTVDLRREYLFLQGETLYITVTGDGSTPLQILGQTIATETIPHVDVYGRLGAIQFLEDALGNPSSNGQILSSQTNGTRSWIDAPTGGIPGIAAQDEGNAVVTASTINFVGNGVTVTDVGGVATVTIPGGGAPNPVSTDLRHGLSAQSDPALVDFGTLTDVPSPSDPQTISTGTTSAGQYFHIFNANTHPIETITDTVLQQVVYNRSGAPADNIFSFVSNARTEGAITYNALTVGPLNAGVDEDYVLRYS